MHFAGYLKLAQRLSQNEQGAFQKEDHHTKFVWFNVKNLKDILIHQRRASGGFSSWLPSQHRRELWEPDSQDGGRGGTKQFRRSLAMKEENKQTMCYLVTTRAVWRGFWGQAVWRLVNRVGVGRSLYVGFKRDFEIWKKGWNWAESQPLDEPIVIAWQWVFAEQVPLFLLSTQFKTFTRVKLSRW